MHRAIISLLFIGAAFGQRIAPGFGGGGGGTATGGGGVACAAQSGSGSIAPAMIACDNLEFTLTGNATAVAIPTGVGASNTLGQITFKLSGGAYTLAGLDATLIGWCNSTGLVDGQYWTQFFHSDANGNIYGDGCADSSGRLFIPGSTSGGVTITVPAVAGTTTVNAVTGEITATKFTISGCSADTTVGGPRAGTFVSHTTGTCTVVITINGATGLTATTGWVCAVSNLTTANLIRQTVSTTTTCTVSGVTVTGDVISFLALAY